MTKKKTSHPHHDSAAASDALDKVTELHNSLTHMSQTSPPQVSFASIMQQVTELRSCIEALHADTADAAAEPPAPTQA